MEKKMIFSSIGVALSALLLIFAFLPCFSYKYVNPLADTIDVNVSGFDAMRAYFTFGDSAQKNAVATACFADDPNSVLGALLDGQSKYLYFVENDLTEDAAFKELAGFNSLVSALAIVEIMLLLFALLALVLGVLAVIGIKAILMHIINLGATVIAGVIGLLSMAIGIFAGVSGQMGITAWSVIIGIIGAATIATPFIAIKLKACVVREALTAK